MNTTDQLMSGYAAYTDATEIGADHSQEAPAITPTTSTQPCAASLIGSVVLTYNLGC